MTLYIQCIHRYLPDKSPVIGPGGSRILKYGPRHQSVVVLIVALDLKMQTNSANFEVFLWSSSSSTNPEIVRSDVCTYILMITSSLMGEPSGFLRNCGIFLSVSEFLILIGFVAFLFVTFFVAQVSNLCMW